MWRKETKFNLKFAASLKEHPTEAGDPGIFMRTGEQEDMKTWDKRIMDKRTCDKRSWDKRTWDKRTSTQGCITLL